MGDFLIVIFAICSVFFIWRTWVKLEKMREIFYKEAIDRRLKELGAEEKKP